ncbi:hypothetical protein GINT2_001603 [Glugoides intestinalis]
MENDETSTFKSYDSNYCNITATFSGIGNIILDVNSIVLSAINQYSLDIKTCPYQTIYLHFEFIVQNLKKFQLKDILFFYENRGEPYFDLAIAMLNDGSFFKYDEIAETLNNKRIAIALCSYERTSLKKFFYNSGLYVGLLDMLIFEVPFALTVIINPNHFIMPALEYKDGNAHEYEGKEDTSDLGFNAEEMRKEFFNFEHDWQFKNSEFQVEIDQVNKILNASHYKKKQIFFDGRIQQGLRIQLEPKEERQIKPFEIEKQWSGKDLDLIIPQIPEKVSMRHLANIRRSAMSLYDGKMHYSMVVRESNEKPKKASGKMLEIIKQNEARQRKEKEKADNIWMSNFFASYSKVPSLKGKKLLLEKTKLRNDYINRKLLLLKIELYGDIWSLEKRSEEVNEKVLVPLYISCLEYLENHVTSDSYNKDELVFVINKLLEAGFEATAREVLEKQGIDINQKFSEKSGKGPSDIDLYFQLKYAGDHLKRTLGTRKDRRVPFDPDQWQVQLLDAVDANKSAIVAAPTSSGKTFICFYAIEKILRSSDKDVVIFCLPTKALVNQVSADIYARFNPKSIKVCLQGTLMPDRCNEPFNCQVMITVPTMLESLLNSRDCSHIKYIIIDEVHKINDASLGLKIERTIHLARCPLLLLSATLGNLDGFYEWFKSIEASKGRETVLVYHSERYCELKPYVYTEKISNESSREEGETPKLEPTLVSLNGMFPYSFAHLKEFGFGNDLRFLPEELLNIYLYIYMILDSSQKKLIKNLAPKKFFKSNIICKADVKEYQDHLLGIFKTWVKEGVLQESQVLEMHKLLTAESHDAFNFDSSEGYLTANILKLLETLREADMLPVIVFNTDPDFVTRLARLVYEDLENSDIKKKKDKMMEKMKKEAKRTRDVEKGKDAWIEESIASEQMVEPDQRDIKFTFLDPLTKLTDYEVKEELADIKGVTREILDMAYRGIGVHHSSINRRYRSAVEILFRKKHIRVLFATETLALGINMPCRTVVFAGDSLQLDPMNYKQISGRAGRRGYDTLGNVVFFGIPKNRVQNLMVSMLPEIQGAYAYSNTSLVSFNIKDSIIQYPLLCAGKSSITTQLSSLSIDQKEVVAHFNALNTKEQRVNLVNFQISGHPLIYPKNYLWDLFISNRDSDPAIFIFAHLFETNRIVWTPTAFMNLIAHLFEVRPAHKTFSHVLPSLPESVTESIADLQNVYLSNLQHFLSPALRFLQKQTSNPLYYLKSFIYTYSSPKNSYLYDFFQHGSSFKVKKNNLIPEGVLWQSLSIIDTFLKSLVRILETYYDPQDERLKKLRPIYAEFNKKFLQIFA